MKPHEQQFHHLFNGDPETEYHRNQRPEVYSSFTQAGLTVSVIICLIPLVYHIFCSLNYNFLPLPELLWNIFVYFTPSRLLDVVENLHTPIRITNLAISRAPRTHAAKSEAMRRILGLDTPGGIIGSVANAGRMRFPSLQGLSITADGRPAGLGNWDNSCYQNSVLQGLASLKFLPEYLQIPNADEQDFDRSETPETKMAEALHGLIKALNDPSNNGKRIWTPATLKSMSSWQQQDAQEYFSKVLDEIDKEVRQAVNYTKNSPGLDSENVLSLAYRNSETSALPQYRNPLEGLIAQRVGCTKCGYSEGLSMIPFNCLTVPLGRSWQYSISQCLDEYTKLETIEGVECGKCTLVKNQHLLSTLLEGTNDVTEDIPIRQQSIDRLAAVNNALKEDDYEEKTLIQKCKIAPKNRVSSTKSRQAVIARPPNSLVVHINRSLFDEMTGELKKNSSEVKFPITLDLGPWCIGSVAAKDLSAEEWILNPDQSMIAGSNKVSRQKGPMYELQAVVTHYGRHENGHYICYKKYPVGPQDIDKKHQWWRMSDDEVMKVSEQNVLSQGGVFMLFYDCMEPTTPTSVAKDNCNEETTSTSPGLTALSLAGLDHRCALGEELSLSKSVDTDRSDCDTTESLAGTPEVSTATSISKHDDEAFIIEARPSYTPKMTTMLPPYIPQAHKEDEGSGQENIQRRAPGSLLMV